MEVDGREIVAGTLWVHERGFGITPNTAVSYFGLSVRAREIDERGTSGFLRSVQLVQSIPELRGRPRQEIC